MSGIICEGRSSGRGGILCCGLLDSGRRRRRGRDARGGCSSFGGRGRVDGSIRGGFVPRWRSSHGRRASEGRCCKSLACGQYLARFSIRAILRARALARGSGSSSVVSRHLSFLRVILAGALARAFGLLVMEVSLHRHVDLGVMLGDSVRYYRADPTYLFIPGVALVILVMAFNLVGDAIRDALDPKTDRQNLL